MAANGQIDPGKRSAILAELAAAADAVDELDAAREHERRKQGMALFRGRLAGLQVVEMARAGRMNRDTARLLLAAATATVPERAEAWVRGHADLSDERIKEQLEQLGAALSAGDVDRLLRLAGELRDPQLMPEPDDGQAGGEEAEDEQAWAWFETPDGRAWLATDEGMEWLRSTEGQRWSRSTGAAEHVVRSDREARAHV